MRKILISIIGALVFCTAFATGENIPTSKSYVDSVVAEKQDKIAANNGAAQVLTNTGTAGEYGTKGIYNSTGEYATQSDALIDAVTMNTAVQNAIDSEFQCVEWAEPNDHTSECLLMDVGTHKNLFDVSKLTNYLRLINNGDGSITCSGNSGDSTCPTGKKLLQVAPDLIVGKNYKLTFDTTGTFKYMLVRLSDRFLYWDSGTTRTITQEMLNGNVYFQIGVNKEHTISNIKLVLVDQVYLPSGN